jgi:hypothetical protein
MRGQMQGTKPNEVDGQKTTSGTAGVSRVQLVELLNEDLTREYQAIIAYVVYSQVIKGAEYVNSRPSWKNIRGRNWTMR